MKKMTKHDYKNLVLPVNVRIIKEGLQANLFGRAAKVGEIYSLDHIYGEDAWLEGPWNDGRGLYTDYADTKQDFSDYIELVEEEKIWRIK